MQLMSSKGLFMFVQTHVAVLPLGGEMPMLWGWMLMHFCGPG